MYLIPKYYRWNSKDSKCYKAKLRNQHAVTLQNKFLCNIACRNANANNVVNDFKECVLYAAADVFQHAKTKITSTFPVNDSFDNECKTEKARLRKYKNCNVGTNGYNRYWELKKSYKSLLQKKKRLHRLNLAADIEALCLNNPRDYWNFWKSNKSKHSVTEILDIETFREYYICQNEVEKNADFDYDLMQKIDEFINSKRYYSIDTLHGLPLCDIQNSPIDKDEVIIALRKSKNNNAAGLDGLPVEFYKYSGVVLDNLLVALFNWIFENGHYPDEWCEGTINPIHKKDDIMILENYRKITIIPALGKIFETVQNNRTIYAKNILGMEDPFQNGFKHDAGATDNAFLLNGLIDIGSARKRPLYVCYIDFKSAFDKVIRTALMFKLLTRGVSGKYFKKIKSMFENSKSRVKYNSSLSDTFENLRGVLQGGVISPTLFEFFLDDLGEYLDTTKGIKVGNIRISHLLFADDLILVSETSSGLQKLIAGLQEFSKQWHMEVNLSKTRISTFNAKYEIGNHVHKFYYFNNEISEANDYDFLDIMFSVKNPRFKRNHKRIKEKALKAIYAARNLAHKSLGNQIPATVLFKMFYSQIHPILDYGTEIWYQRKPVEELEVIHTGFIKKTLGVKKKQKNINTSSIRRLWPLSPWDPTKKNCLSNSGVAY